MFAKKYVKNKEDISKKKKMITKKIKSPNKIHNMCWKFNVIITYIIPQ